MSPSEAVEREQVKARAGMDPGALIRMAPAANTEVQRQLERFPELAERFDWSDDDCPRVLAPCRSCRAEFWIEFPGGVVPAMLPWVTKRACEACAHREEVAEEVATNQANRDRRIEASGLPLSLGREVSWETMLEKGATPEESVARARAIVRARAWAERDESFSKLGLLLWGPAGSGKTRLAATAAMTWLQREPITWVSVAVLMAELAGAWNDDDRKKALKVITSRKPVVLDDFDKINPTPSVMGQLFAALDKREQAKVPIVVTTNRSPAQLEQLLSDPIVSRLVGMCEVLPFPGPDRRLELGEAA